MAREIGVVQLRKQIEIRTLGITFGSIGGHQVENRRAAGTQWRALKIGGQKAIRPVGSSTLWKGAFGQDDERRQVLVFSSQAIGRPCAERRVAAKPVASIHLIAGRD